VESLKKRIILVAFCESGKKKEHTPWKEWVSGRLYIYLVYTIDFHFSHIWSVDPTEF
jgi:hypothetical protein